jgi:hypothetical protein
MFVFQHVTGLRIESGNAAPGRPLPQPARIQLWAHETTACRPRNTGARAQSSASDSRALDPYFSTLIFPPAPERIPAQILHLLRVIFNEERLSTSV